MATQYMNYELQTTKQWLREVLFAISHSFFVIYYNYANETCKMYKT